MSGAFILLLAAALLVAAIVLLKRGLFPRRTGITPFCRCCGYNLTGADWTVAGARCPECGALLAGLRAVVVGERCRRRGLAASGVLCLVLALTPAALVLAGRLFAIDWYRLAPTARVLADAGSPADPVASRALRELERRLADGRLSRAQCLRLADVCLAEQARPARRVATDTALALLGRLYAAHQLAPGQSDRFFTNMVRLSLRIRPRIVCGQETTVAIEYEARAPPGMFAVQVEQGETRAGPDVLAPGGGKSRRGLVGSGRLGTVVTLKREGRFVASQDATVRIFDDPRLTGRDGSAALHTRMERLEAEVEALAEEPPGLFTLRHSPELDRQLASAVRVRGLTAEPRSGGGEWLLDTLVDVDGPTPVGLAFDVTAEGAGQTVSLGSVVFGRLPPGSSHSYGVHGVWPGEPPPRLRLVLTSSQAAALRTPDLFEIWDGELWFEDVDVQRAAAPGAGPTGPATLTFHRPDVCRRRPWAAQSASAPVEAATRPVAP